MTSDALAAAVNEVLDTVLPGGQRPDLNETETRRHAIDPIIEVLGYRSLDQVRREARLSVSGQVVDYLLAAGETQVVVEAKRLLVDLGDREAGQLVGYCAQEGIRWALLSNGIRWQVFDTEVRGNWEAKRVATIDLEAARRDGCLEDALRPLALFARDALAEGDAALSAWSQRERARSHLEELLANPGSSAVKAIVTSMRNGGIQISPADVVDLLRARVAPPTAAPPSPAPSAPSPTAAASPQDAHTGDVSYFLLSSWTEKGFDSLQYLRVWLPTGAWWIGPSAVDRLAPQPGDQCCFFATRGGSAVTGRGIVATAEIAGVADQEIPRHEWPGPGDWSPGCFKLPLRNVRWLPEPLWPNRETRHKVDALQPERPGQRLQGIGARSIRRLTQHDFNLLTGRD
jgi:hypothetical protein